MGVILFFMVLSAWCAQELFDIPSSWVLGRGHKASSRQRSNFAGGQNLQSIFITNLSTNPRQGQRCVWENIQFKLRKDDLFIGMDFSTCDLDRGSLFEVSLFCHICGDETRGYVVSTPKSVQARCFSVLEPTEKEGSTSVHFSRIDAHEPKDICEYRAEETRFTVKRFLCEYKDLSRYVVSAEVTYDNPHNVVIEWGLREANGAMQVTDEKKQHAFKLHCRCAQNTES